jgi:hypothetical protein
MVGIISVVMASASPATAQTSRAISVFGAAGWMAGDPGATGGGVSYSGTILLPVTRTLRVETGAVRFNTAEDAGSTTDQTLYGVALLAEGPPGRRARFLAAGGVGRVSYHERDATGRAWREGAVPVLHAELGTIISLSGRVLARVDGVFWGGEMTGAAGVRFGVGYRF